MNKYLLVTFALLLNTSVLFSQEFKAQIIDSLTQDPIPYAAIQIDTISGTISNEEGFFTLDFKNKTVTSLSISCLGYQSIDISIDDIKKNNYIIALSESVNALDEVYISDTKPSVDSIIARVHLRLEHNYISGFSSHKVFYRSSNYSAFKKLDVDIDKASSFKKRDLASVNKTLDSLSYSVKNSNAAQFTDFLGNIVLNDSNKAKIKVIKATELFDKGNGFSAETLQSKAQKIMLKYLDQNKYYKIKSGLLKLEDSLNFKKIIEEEENRKNEFITNYYTRRANGLLKYAKIYDNSFLTNILNPKLYKHTLEDVTYHNGDFVYVINYFPKKAKSKFTGKLYISEETHAVIKTDYQYSKGKKGSSMNLKFLLGLKFSENIRTGTVIYQKDEDTQKYLPQYIKEDVGVYAYVSRPLKLIEQGGNKSKVKFSFKIEMNTRNKEELLCLSTKEINNVTYSGFLQAKKTPYQVLDRYDGSIWKNEITLEPLEEMKRFRAANNN